MFFVEARYHRDASRVGAQVRYIAHREEGLTDGRRRELYGIGDRYRLIIELLDEGQNEDRAAALNALRAGISSMAFSSAGQLPTRDELHDRS